MQLKVLESQNEVYKTEKLLGQGAFGKAFLVRHIPTGELRVVKQMRIEHMSKEEKQQTIRQALILRTFNHPSIVKFIEVYLTSKHKLKIVMQYAEGGDISKAIAAQKQAKSLFSQAQILDWLTQLCLAMKHVHDRKVLHRDIKGQNIFLTASNTLKLGDFGIARILSQTHDKARTVVGTPYYLSPEIIENKPYSFQSDIWSMGVVLYQLCALQPPFNATSLQMLALKIVKGNYSPLPSQYSSELKTLIKDMLQIDPSRRPLVEQILRKPFIQDRIKKYLSQTSRIDQFSHTVLHHHQIQLKKQIKLAPKISPVINPKVYPKPDPTVANQNKIQFQEQYNKQEERNALRQKIQAKRQLQKKQEYERYNKMKQDHYKQEQIKMHEKKRLQQIRQQQQRQQQIRFIQFKRQQLKQQQYKHQQMLNEYKKEQLRKQQHISQQMKIQRQKQIMRQKSIEAQRYQLQKQEERRRVYEIAQYAKRKHKQENEIAEKKNKLTQEKQIIQSQKRIQMEYKKKAQKEYLQKKKIQQLNQFSRLQFIQNQKIRKNAEERAKLSEITQEQTITDKTECSPNNDQYSNVKVNSNLIRKYSVQTNEKSKKIPQAPKFVQKKKKQPETVIKQNPKQKSASLRAQIKKDRESFKKDKPINMFQVQILTPQVANNNQHENNIRTKKLEQKKDLQSPSRITKIQSANEDIKQQTNFFEITTSDSLPFQINRLNEEQFSIYLNELQNHLKIINKNIESIQSAESNQHQQIFFRDDDCLELSFTLEENDKPKMEQANVDLNYFSDYSKLETLRINLEDEFGTENFILIYRTLEKEINEKGLDGFNIIQVIDNLGKNIDVGIIIKNTSYLLTLIVMEQKINST